jgi:hypothetical protein
MGGPANAFTSRLAVTKEWVAQIMTPCTRAATNFPSRWNLLQTSANILKVATRGRVAQLGERIVRNDEVAGSIPVSSTKSCHNLTRHLPPENISVLPEGSRLN